MTSIFGLEEWGCDLTDTAQRMAKKFGTGAAACEIDYKEDRGREGILVQGDCTERFKEFVENELGSFNIDLEFVFYEDGGNKKNRTMGRGK